MSFEKYLRKKQQVIDLLESVKEKTFEQASKQFIEQKLKNIREDRYIISIFGRFSNGKSTFLNALMGFGEEVLVEDDFPSTAAITRLKYPNDLSLLNNAEITYVDGTTEMVPVEEIKNYSARNKDYDVENKIKEITLYLDSEYLKNGVEIVDTPGFNSTYLMHTDIAKGHVEKSDASIMLFSYEQPGTDTELKFLNYISLYMNRVFFVLNKIDKEDDLQNRESAIKSTVEDVRKKLQDRKLNIEGKEIYPISARLAKEAIKEKSIAKREYSRFDNFKTALSSYLTSDENSRDRLLEPLSAVQTKLKEERQLLEERIRICSKSHEDIKNELENERKKIENLEKELVDKKKYIQNNVRSAVINAKTSLEENSKKITEEVKEELKDISSQFHVRLTDFGGMAIGVHDKFLKNWSVLSSKLEDRLVEIIDENIDSEKEAAETKDRLLAIIKRSLDINKADVESPKFDFKELQEIDKEIEKRKREYEGYKEKLLSCKDDKQRHMSLISEKEKLERQIDKLTGDRDKRLDAIGEGKIHRGETMASYEKKRGGLFGGIGNFLFGPKTINKRESFVDYSEVDFIEKKRKEVQEKFSSEIEVKEKEMENKLYEAMLLGDIDSKIFDVELDSKLARERYLKVLDKEEKEKQKLSSQIIKVSKDNYFKEISRAMEEYERVGRAFLDGNKDLIAAITLSALDGEKRRLEDSKNNIYTMSTMAGASPEDMQMEIKTMYDGLQGLLECISELKKFGEDEL